MEKLMMLIALVFTGCTYYAESSKVNGFADSLPENQKSITVFNLDSTTIKETTSLKGGLDGIGIRLL